MASGGHGLFTPPGSHTVSRTSRTPVDYISPSIRRCSVVLTPPSAAQLKGVLTGVNDDEAEKRERRRSKVLELQRRHNDLGSPAATTPDAPNNRRKSALLSGFTNAQLTEHYANCIKLSTENKINSKNAFGLHLIDYMADMLKKKEMTNFQVASSTLDASAKIYAGRVDAIHSETYKVLTGLGRGAEKQDKGDEEVPVEEGGEQPDGTAGQPKRKKKSRRGKIIETNLSKLNVKKFDMEFEVDPLFSKTSAAFDEGGTGGLLLNHLRCLDNTSELVLDSATVVTGPEHDRRDSMTTTSRLIDIADLKDRYVGVNFDVLKMCPEFSTFEFTNWDRDSQDQSALNVSQLGTASHAFDLEAEAEPIPDLCDEPEDEGGGGEDDFNPDMLDQEDLVSEVGTEGGKSLQSAVFGDDKEAQLVQSAIKSIQNGTVDPHVLNAILKQGTIGTLMEVLAAEPSDYSYFNMNLLRTWAGPDHWKLKPKSKDPSKDGGEKKKRDKKEPFYIIYNEDTFDAFFKVTKAATTLSRATLDKYSKASTLLPEDLHYESKNLFQLFSKPNMMIKRQRHESEDVDDAVSNYDYDNVNDRNDFCPSLQPEFGRDDDDDNHDDSGGDFFNETVEVAEPEGPGSQDTLLTAGDATILTGENLVEQPRKVAKIDIGYARTAKKIDMKRLKGHMWDVLSVPAEGEVGQGDQPQKHSDQDDENEGDKSTAAAPEADKTASASSRSRRSVTGAHAFSELVKRLPQRLPKHLTENFSVPIAFVCLLHLANEKTLSLTGLEDMSDFSISQG